MDGQLKKEDRRNLFRVDSSRCETGNYRVRKSLVDLKDI